MDDETKLLKINGLVITWIDNYCSDKRIEENQKIHSKVVRELLEKIKDVIQE